MHPRRFTCLLNCRFDAAMRKGIRRRGGGRDGGIVSGAKQRVILICDLCGKSFQRAKEYAEHRRSHTGERPYSCDVCGKTFGRRRTMTEHQRIHTGDR